MTVPLCRYLRGPVIPNLLRALGGAMAREQNSVRSTVRDRPIARSKTYLAHWQIPRDTYCNLPKNSSRAQVSVNSFPPGCLSKCGDPCPCQCSTPTVIIFGPLAHPRPLCPVTAFCVGGSRQNSYLPTITCAFLEFYVRSLCKSNRNRRRCKMLRGGHKQTRPRRPGDSHPNNHPNSHRPTGGQPSPHPALTIPRALYLTSERCFELNSAPQTDLAYPSLCSSPISWACSSLVQAGWS